MQTDLTLGGPAAPGRELVGVRECARQLGVAPSTVSRQIGRLYVNLGTAERPLLDMDQVRRARGQDLNTAMQRGAAAAPTPVPASAAGGEEDAPDTRGYWDKIYARERALQAMAARRAELGALVERVAVDDAGFELGRRLREELDALATNAGVPLASLSEPREVTVWLAEQFRRVLEHVAEELDRRLKTEAVGEELDDVVPVEA